MDIKKLRTSANLSARQQTLAIAVQMRGATSTLSALTVAKTTSISVSALVDSEETDLFVPEYQVLIIRLG